jgi:long-chain fatty acid transport protein
LQSRRRDRGKWPAALAAALVAQYAVATDGYFSHGYGMKAKGRGGSAIAVADDAFGGANNPATMVFAGNRLDLGIDAFTPRRSASRTGLGPGLDGQVHSGRNSFGIPEFGYNRLVRSDLSLGLTAYGNGGMNTDYPGGQFNCGQGPANMLCGVGRLGVDLSQLIVAASVAYSFAEGQSVGVAPLLAYQRFAATGLQAFAGIPGFSVAPDKVTNNEHGDSTGVGVRVGYLAQLGNGFSVGATYASKIHMGRFSEYTGLFAGGGSFDIPENYGIGAAWKPMPAVAIAVDYNRINYSGIDSIANPSLVQAQLGASNGAGFGWRDVDVWKLGVEYASSDRWTWRAGINRGDDPITPNDVTFNILAPGVVTNHVTLGFTHVLSSGSELTMAYMHGLHHSVQGASSLPAFLGGAPAGIEKISMHQNSIGIQYVWKL